MSDRISRRAEEIRTAQQQTADAERQRAEDASTRQQRRAAAAARLPELLEMGRFRQIFLGREERAALQQQRARQEQDEWIETRIGGIEDLCDAFRNWAVRAQAPQTIKGGWFVGNTFSERVETEEVFDHKFPIHTVHYRTHSWYIAAEQPERDEHYPTRTLADVRTYTSESTVRNDRAVAPRNIQATHPLEIRVQDDEWYATTMDTLEEGIARLVATRPGTPWTGVVEEIPDRHAPRTDDRLGDNFQRPPALSNYDTPDEY